MLVSHARARARRVDSRHRAGPFACFGRELMPGDRKTSSRSASPARTTTTKASVGTTVCRYGATSATVFEGAETGALSSAADIAPAVERLRATFDSDKTLSLAWRVGQLQAMRRMVTEGRGELCKAMQVDLHKSAFESEVGSRRTPTPTLILTPNVDPSSGQARACTREATPYPYPYPLTRRPSSSSSSARSTRCPP